MSEGVGKAAGGQGGRNLEAAMAGGGRRKSCIRAPYIRFVDVCSAAGCSLMRNGTSRASDAWGGSPVAGAHREGAATNPDA